MSQKQANLPSARTPILLKLPICSDSNNVIVGFDVMEINPLLETAGRTSLLPTISIMESLAAIFYLPWDRSGRSAGGVCLLTIVFSN